MDNVVDDIYHLSEVLVLVPIREVTPELREQVDVMCAMADTAVEAIDRLHNPRRRPTRWWAAWPARRSPGSAATSCGRRACAKIGVFIVLAPLIGLTLGLVLTTVVQWMFARVRKLEALNRGFRRGQLISAAAYSLGHGGNDAQKTMGIILAVLIASGTVAKDADTPLWVVLAAHGAIGAGTLFGGWRIVKTMGSRITRLQPVGGMAAEMGAAVTSSYTSHAGIPVSTTHTITGAIVGVCSSRRLSAVRWGVAGRVVIAWIVTIPGAGIVAMVVSKVIQVLA
jgi:phosphate/sulfate permease